MIGAIIIWSGAIVDIPVGWQLCDGTNNTPDLRNRFVHGAADQGQIDSTGGSVNHHHDFTGDGHSHVLTLATPGLLGGPNNLHGSVLFDNATGTTDNEQTLPPYYCLAYIQRMTL